MVTKSAFAIYNHVFGYRAIPYPQGQQINLMISGREQAERLSKLGAVITKRLPNGAEAFCPITIRHEGRTFELPNSTIAMTAKKRIVETPLIARRGSVKELIQVEDYEFQIRGVVITDDQEEDGLPQEAISQLNDLFNINAPVELENAFTEIFLQADNRVVISEMQLPDMKGITGAQAYGFRLSSDSILILEEL
jgi:hypothetical protein